MAAKEGVDLFDRAGSDGENTTPEGNASRTHGKGFHQCVSMLLQTTLQVFTVAVRVLSGKASLYGVAEHLRQNLDTVDDVIHLTQLTRTERKKLLRKERKWHAQKDPAQKLVEFSKSKKWWLQKQSELEKRKAALSAGLIENIEDVCRTEVEKKILEVDKEIQETKDKLEWYQKEIDVWEHRLQRMSQLQSEDSRHLLQQAMRRGHILATITNCVFLGSAGAGKTSLLYLLCGINPPVVDHSTQCSASTFHAVSGTRIQLHDEGWVVVPAEDMEEMIADYIPFLCDGLPDDPEISAQHFEPQHSSCEAHGEETPSSQDLIESTSEDQTTSLSSDAPKQVACKLLDDLVKRMNQLAVHGVEKPGRSKSFNSNWMHLIDSGGQPEFYDLLPIFIHHTSCIVLVQRLCDSLKDYPTVKVFSGEGNVINIPSCFPFTILDIVMLLTRTVHSIVREGKLANIITVGTHRDLEKNCRESRDEKNKMLFSLLHPHFPDYLVLYGDAMQPIFPLNTRDPDEDDKQVAKLLRQVIENSAPDPVKIPLWWYLLELALGRLAGMLSRKILSRNECLGVAFSFGFSEEECDAALRFFCEHNLCLYYPDVLPNVVFLDPQTPLDKASELVQERYRLIEAKQGKLSQYSQVALEAKWLKFRDLGIVQPEFLEKFPKHYKKRIFIPADLIHLFQHLLIFAPISANEYFMPCLLNMLPFDELDKHRVFSSAVAPLFFHFPSGWPQSGIFCCLVVFLINQCKWQILLPGTGSPILIAKNCVKFRIPRSACTVTLIDNFAYFEIHISAPPPVCRKMCPTIRNIIYDGIDATNTTLRYDDAKPLTAICCPHSHSSCYSYPPHVATVTEDNEYWECTQDQVFGRLTEREKVWFQPTTAITEHCYLSQLGMQKLHTAPELREFISEVAVKIPDKWKQVAIGLGLDESEIGSIEAEMPPEKYTLCYVAVLDEWKHKGAAKYTWDTLVKALRSSHFDDLAMTLEYKLQGRLC